MVTSAAPHIPTSLDPLGVLASTRVVVNGSHYVAINRGTIDALAPALARDSLEVPPWDAARHFSDGGPRTTNWLLALNAVNFSFWGEPRWRVEHAGQTLDGYWALAAAMRRAVEEGFPVYDAGYLANLSPRDALQIFRGTAPMPLLDRRIENLQEVGRVLRDRWDGQFSNLVEESGFDAPTLVKKIVANFTSFGDVGDFWGRPVYFFKRAQLLAADLHAAFAGQTWGALRRLDLLTAFADYKLPQVLRHWGILAYDASLSQKVDNRFAFPPGSREELEIRAATVWACEHLRAAFAAAGREVTTAEVDYYLWDQSQRLVSPRPYHLCRTIYY